MAPEQPKIEDWARLAAFIDGEGCIDIPRQVNTHRKPLLHISHRLRVTVTNTDPRLTQWLKATFGGKTYAMKRQNRSRICFQWKVFGKEAESLLRSCAHLLVIKKEQADIAFALRETYTKKAKLKGRISVAVVDFRENCRQRLKVLRNPQAA